jgi:hypothetical protein
VTSAVQYRSDKVSFVNTCVLINHTSKAAGNALMRRIDAATTDVVLHAVARLVKMLQEVLRHGMAPVAAQKSLPVVV